MTTTRCGRRRSPTCSPTRAPSASRWSTARSRSITPAARPGAWAASRRRAGEFGWQGALAHAGLRFFEREHVAADLGWSGDWFRLQRMLRAGVRIGHLEQVTCDYYPSFLWGGGD